MIYTFSPNWYKPQCLHFTKSSLYYCSNYLLYHYDLPLKAVTRQLCFRQIALDNYLNHRDIKINAIASNQHSLLVGLNQAYIAIVDRQAMQLDKLIQLDGYQSVEYIYPYKEGPFNKAILCNKDGTFCKYHLEEQKPFLERIELKHKLSGVKAIYSIRNIHFAVFTRGTILIYNHDFTILHKNVEVSNHETIYSVDWHHQDDHDYFCFLTKTKQSHTITVFQFHPKEQFPLEFKKKIQQIGDVMFKFDVSSCYPKKFAQKLKNTPKASLNIKFINRQTIILTGKLGETTTINCKKIELGSSLVIKPYAFQEEEDPRYSCWPDSRHYKEIYCIYEHCDRLYMISTDHNLTIWLKQGNSVKYLYSIKFLTAPVQYFFNSEVETKTVYALLKDSAIRSFIPLEEGSHQINEYWKFSKKYKIKKAVFHPSEEGIVAMATECHRLQLYDIYEDRLMKLVEIGEDIINISFEFPDIHKQIEGVLNFEMKEEKYQHISHFQKTMDNKTILLVQTQKHLILISQLADKQLVFFKGPREKRLQRIHLNCFWDKRLLLTSQTKNNQLSLLLRCQGKNIQFKSQLKYSQGRVFFKVEKNSNNLSIFNTKGNRFSLMRTVIGKEEVSIDSVSEFVFQQQIDYLHINYSDSRVAVYSQKDDAIQVMQMNSFMQEKYEVGKQQEGVIRYEVNMKVDTLCFYQQDYLILGTKDQSIKMVYLKEQHHKQPKVVSKELATFTKDMIKELPEKEDQFISNEGKKEESKQENQAILPVITTTDKK